MTVKSALEKLKQADRALLADVCLAVAVAAAFAGFAITVMQMDGTVGSTRVFPPGKIVYM